MRELLVLLALSACHGAGGAHDTDAARDTTGDTDTDADDDDTAPDPCADLSWTTVGQPFTLTWCQPCHASAVKRADRQGAPADVTFDTYEQTLERAQDVRMLALGDTPVMPPAGGPDDDARARMRAWLDCETR